MAAEASQTAVEAIKLPLQIVGAADLSRLIREFETLDDFFAQAAIRYPEQPAAMPEVSGLLHDFIALNNLDLLRGDQRQNVYQSLGELKVRAPVLHISFAVAASAAFVAKIVIWLRANIHPQLLVTVGLEPSIAAGCVVRTTNKQFDFSLRRHFEQQRGLLVDSLQPSYSGDVIYE
ncbi:MAG: hypothetical protein ACREGA_04725 [Candidatus Saccharimonadales bacterium]